MSLAANAQTSGVDNIVWPEESTMIYEQPEGQNVTDVIGKNFSYLYESDNLYVEQTYNGIASYVIGTDGNIYVHNPIPGLRAGTYLKLEPAGDGRYVAHTPQVLEYDEDYGGLVYMMRLVISTEGGLVRLVPDVREDGTVDTDIYFTYTDGVLRQQRAEGETFNNPRALLCAVLRGGSFYGSGVNELTIMPSPYKSTVVPEGVEVKSYGMSYGTQYNETLSAQASVAFDGNTVYISDPENPKNGYWIKGSYGDGQIVIGPQYVGADDLWGVHYFLVPGKMRISDDGKHLDLAESIVLSVDEEAGTITAPDDASFIITADITGGKLLEAYMHPAYTRVDVKPAVPAAPEFYDVGSYNQFFGREVKFNLVCKDVDGNPISADHLAYRVYMGPDNIYTFTTDKYVKLTEPMSLIPYSFADEYDFPVAYGDYHRFYLYEEEISGLGIQSVYTVEGETNVSEITWWGDVAGIRGVAGGSEPVATSYFDLQGRRVESPRAGVYVVRSVMPDGSVRTEKRVVK